MPKIVGTRERVHQPFYDSLIRVDGAADLRNANVGVFGPVQARSQLFTRQGADIAVSNLTTGGFFPSDQTFVCLAVRVWTYFRFNWESSRRSGTAGFPVINGGVASPAGLGPSVNADRLARVHKLYHQTQNQLFWQFQAGDKPQLTTYTAYTPMAGGLDGFFTGDGVPPGVVAGGGGGGGGENFLAAVGDFLVMGQAGITNVPAVGTIIDGNVAVGPSSPTVVGFPPGIITGIIEAGAGATTAQTALTAAVVVLNALGPDTPVGPNLSALVLSPDYYSVGAAILPGVLTLDGGGDPNAIFVFQIASSFTIGPGASIVLTNGTQPHNVYFVAVAGITVDTTASVQGNLIAGAAITFANGATLTGRALAQSGGGAVTFDNNQINADPNDPNVGPGAGAGAGSAAANAALRYRYRANNGIPTSSALMRLARPILIPPRQGFVVIAIASPIGQAQGASVIEGLNGQVPNNDAWGPTGTGGTITGTPSAAAIGGSFSSGLSTSGADDIEKNVVYLVDGVHSRDVL